MDDVATIQSLQINYFRKMKRQEKQAKENLPKRKTKSIEKCCY